MDYSYEEQPEREAKVSILSNITESFRYPYFIVLCLVIFLSGCGDNSPPTSSLEVARNGINGGALSKDAQYAVVGSG